MISTRRGERNLDRHLGCRDASEELPLQVRILVGSRPDLEECGQSNRSLGMQRFVDPSYSREDVLEVSLDVRSVRVQLRLQVRFLENAVGSLHFCPNGHSGAYGDDLNLGYRFHRSMPFVRVADRGQLTAQGVDRFEASGPAGRKIAAEKSDRRNQQRHTEEPDQADRATLR